MFQINVIKRRIVIVYLRKKIVRPITFSGGKSGRAKKKILKIQITMEVGGSHSEFFFLKSSKNTSKPVDILE